jgi:uncharacterized protein YndB with AHSA1/START domain
MSHLIPQRVPNRDLCGWGGRHERGRNNPSKIIHFRTEDLLMATTAITPDLDAVVSEIQIAAPPERVFQALTKSDELSRWFSSPNCPVKQWTMDARLGGHYHYATEKGTVVVNEISEFECSGEILEYDPPRLLAYTWVANWHDQSNQATVVRWQLTPQAGGTHVKVTHSGLATLPIARKDYSGGWTGVMAMLKTFVEK